MRQAIFMFLLPLSLRCTICYSQTSNMQASLKGIIARIRTVNAVQSEHVGLSGRGENYTNFLQLKKLATIDDLIKLLDHPNNVVACYAAMALADTAYPGLKTVLSKFIDDKRPVKVNRGCLAFSEDVSTELYLEYWNSLSVTEMKTDKMLMELDSVVLYSENVDWLLVYKALENRIYSDEYKSQIEALAFEKHNTSAINYLYNWYRAEYAEQLKHVLLQRLRKTNFVNEGVGEYYKNVSQLFSFKSLEIKKAIINKMKKDRFWENEKDRFKYLLEDNYIYDIDRE